VLSRGLLFVSSGAIMKAITAQRFIKSLEPYKCRKN